MSKFIRSLKFESANPITAGTSLDFNNDVLIIGPSGFDAVGENASLYLGDLNHYIQAEHTQGLRLRTSNEITFETNGNNERMVIATTGNVGIGITNPSEQLHIANNLLVDGTSKLSKIERNSYSHHISQDYFLNYTALTATNDELCLFEIQPQIGSFTWITGEVEVEVMSRRAQTLMHYKNQKVSIKFNFEWDGRPTSGTWIIREAQASYIEYAASGGTQFIQYPVNVYYKYKGTRVSSDIQPILQVYITYSGSIFLGYISVKGNYNSNEISNNLNLTFPSSVFATDGDTTITQVTSYGFTHQLSTGNIGLGTIVPTHFFNMQRSQNSAIVAQLINTDTGASAAIEWSIGQSTSVDDTLRLLCFGSGYTTSGGFVQDGAAIVSGSNLSGGLSLIARNAAGIIRFYTSSSTAERMRIDAAGNVGIGTTNPTFKLDILDSTFNILKLKSTNVSAGPHINLHDLNDNSATFAWIGDGSSGVGARDSALEIRVTGRINFTTTSNTTNPEMTILNSGNVGIGTTNPTFQLQLSTDSAAKPTTNTWTISSDQRLKEGITGADYDLCYQDVKDLELKYFKWKDEYIESYNVQDVHKIGWIADDVEAIFPNAVTTYDVDITSSEYLITGMTEGIKSLNTDLIYASMFGAMKKMIEKIEFLEQQNIDFGTTIASLMAYH